MQRPRGGKTDVERGVPQTADEGARIALLACVSSTNRNSSLSVEFWGVTKLCVRRVRGRGATTYGTILARDSLAEIKLCKTRRKGTRTPRAYITYVEVGARPDNEVLRSFSPREKPFSLLFPYYFPPLRKRFHFPIFKSAYFWHFLSQNPPRKHPYFTI